MKLTIGGLSLDALASSSRPRSTESSRAPRSIGRMISGRYVRASIAAVAAIGLGAWLSLADLALPGGGQTGPGTAWYLLIGAAGVAVVSKLVRRHALWLIPVTTAAFGASYQRWFWHKPRGIPDSGMDAIGYYPTDVVWAMLPVTTVVALVLAA